jgi:maltose alpha-D-glucosyltransferase/alpha-amylase
MGEDLDLPGRAAIRTPMQWSPDPGGGFTTADPDAALVAPLSATGRYGYRRVNVRDQQRDPSSLLRWFGQLIRCLRECPEIGVGTCTVLDRPDVPTVLVHRFDAPEGSILLLHNLSDEPVSVDVGRLDGVAGRPWDVFGDADYPRPTITLRRLPLNGYGYRWIRLRESRAD